MRTETLPPAPAHLPACPTACLPPCRAALQQVEVGLPDVLMQGVEAYTRFFDETNQKTRRLAWQVGRSVVTGAPSAAAAAAVLLLLLRGAAAVLLLYCGAGARRRVATILRDCRLPLPIDSTHPPPAH